eukprot:CAMPEP_0174311250 /NCGR_PEP_ID=MMETSP0810-20121108/3602_1 /TAXON_ID=73025 ORGANISM="Eutreptiella gymnastica-like, Strain CCMP1594" /NCGR_SAMPLE_ID=MMETSP0810 /ASSEMBLY_ACC=CAM_ASM_000659 /LENGTH=313 /DNA_ID=CAMNT_0015419455 /DNA_START=154 /DNA_END=1093 /DNA_ORIENTATION=-
MVDKAVMENASGRNTIWGSMGGTCKQILFSPHRFLMKPEFMLVCSVYAVTYGTANSMDTMSKRKVAAQQHRERIAKADPTYVMPPPSILAKYVSPATAQLLSTTAANMSSSMMKDSILAKMFGSGPARSFPLQSYGAFVCRDTITIAAGFTIPGPLSEVFHENSSWSKGNCEIAAQLLCPVSMQVICTPIHLMGLDYYNRPEVTFSDRVAFIKGQYAMVLVVRMARMLPAFGFGGLGNKYFRRTFKEKLDANPLPENVPHPHLPSIPRPHEIHVPPLPGAASTQGCLILGAAIDGGVFDGSEEEAGASGGVTC